MLTITPQRILFTAIAAVCLGLIVSHLLANNSHTISIDPGEGSHSIDRDEYMSSLARTASNILPKISRNTTTSPKMASLTHAKITTRPSSTRGTANHGWLDTKHSFSFASWHDPRYMSFGSLRVLNEDRVAPQTGFPTHPHRDAEIFSYILSGELTHRDSLQRRGQESTTNKDQFYRMKRGDVQFTTGGRGIAHSEQNEHARDWVHFLQIWVLPWKKGLTPIYHTETFSEEAKRQTFVEIVTPLKAGPEATAEEEKAAVPASKGSIPIHADLVFAAAIIAPGRKFEYRVGGSREGTTRHKSGRKVYVHVTESEKWDKKGRVRLDGREDGTLGEGDAAFVKEVNDGDVLTVESIGETDAEVVIIDSN